MARLAAAGNPGFSVDDGEVRARQKSYTVLTLERLRAELDDCLLSDAEMAAGPEAWQLLPDPFGAWTEEAA